MIKIYTYITYWSRSWKNFGRKKIQLARKVSLFISYFKLASGSEKYGCWKTERQPGSVEGRRRNTSSVSRTGTLLTRVRRFCISFFRFKAKNILYFSLSFALSEYEWRTLLLTLSHISTQSACLTFRRLLESGPSQTSCRPVLTLEFRKCSVSWDLLSFTRL